MSEVKNNVASTDVELEDEIGEDVASCQCALCEDAILKHEPATVVTAHGYKYLVHSFCLDDLFDTDEEADEARAASGQA